MVRMEGAEHSSLTTPNHRWPVVTLRYRVEIDERRQDLATGRWLSTAPQAKRAAVEERRWTTTASLAALDKIPIAATCTDVPNEAKWSDALVELVAWFWTEGCISRSHGRPCRNVTIYQSSKNAANQARIRASLSELFGVRSESLPRAGSGTDGIPRWREYQHGLVSGFYLSADAGEQLLTLAPNRVPTHEFLRSLTKAQLELFITVSMLADNNGKRSLAQKSKAAAEAFALACILSGRAVSIKQRAATSSTPYPMWAVQMMRKMSINPRAAHNAKSGPFTISDEEYEGKIWCPRTQNATWMARRSGSVYFTGNTFLYDSYGTIFEGRGWGVVGAHTLNYNSQGHGFAFLGDGDHELTPEALESLRWLVAESDRRYGTKPIRGHRDVFATHCPGDWIYGRLGSLRDGPAPPSPGPIVLPSPPVTGDDYYSVEVMVTQLPVLRRGAKGQYVKNMQGLMVANGCILTIDGDFGPTTERELGAWQGRAQIGSDSICGPATWRRLLDI
jgi:peptidoglycan hydrolase-like protein with peptidoglycan-binding domain